jgi:hypothetical protein
MLERFGYALLACSLLVWAVFVFPIFMQTIEYIQAKESVAPESIEWSLDRIHDELWKPVVRFKYTVNGTTYQREERLQEGRYRNPYAAEEALKELKAEKTKAWYSASSPSHATVERFFPLKKILYALMTFLILLYGAWLARYVYLEQLIRK